MEQRVVMNESSCKQKHKVELVEIYSCQQRAPNKVSGVTSSSTVARYLPLKSPALIVNLKTEDDCRAGVPLEVCVDAFDNWLDTGKCTYATENSV